MEHKITDVMKQLMWTILIVLLGSPVAAQKYITESSSITFYSEAPLEDIDATNTKATSIFDSANGEIVFSVPIKEFIFKRSLMQEHFNERYLESEKFPKSTFKGNVKNFSVKPGKQSAVAEGELTIHGVTRKVSFTGDLEFKDNRVYINSEFIVKLEEYDIKIPSILFQNIAEEIEVKVKFTYKEYE